MSPYRCLLLALLSLVVACQPAAAPLPTLPMPDPATALRASLDRDGDGCLVVGELRGTDPGLVRRLDTDEDSCLSTPEVAAALR